VTDDYLLSRCRRQSLVVPLMIPSTMLRAANRQQWAVEIGTSLAAAAGPPAPLSPAPQLHSLMGRCHSLMSF
jgi:hypothetical protein